MKKILCFCLLFLLCLGQAFAAENLIQNADFELVENGLPQGFITDAYNHQANVSVFKSSDKAHSGTHSIYIKNSGKNDARFVQTVTVEPNSYYKLSGYILAGEIQDGKGANLSIEGVYSFSQSLYDTQDKWEYVELFGKTGPSQTTLKVFARLGGYSGESRGFAYFDDIALEKVEEPRLYDNWYASAPQKQEEPKETGNHYTLIVFVMVLYAICAYLLWTRSGKIPTALLIIAFIIAFLLRIIIAMQIHGYGVDMGCFTGWAAGMHTHGTNFYNSGMFVDYPPAYLYVLWLNGSIFAAGNRSIEVVRLITKFLPILCDMASAYMLFALTKKYINIQKASLLAILYAFNPVSILISAAWGQIDSVFTLLIILAVYCLLHEKEQFALPLYVLAVLVKPQALVFGPVALLYTIYQFKDTRFWIKMALGALLALCLAVAIVLPFTLKVGNLQWLFDLYGNTLQSYPFASINTGNLYYLMAANWQPQDSPLPLTFALSYIVLLSGFGVAVLLYHKNAFANLKTINKWGKKAWLSYLMLAYTIGFILIETMWNSYVNFSILNHIFIIALAAILLYFMKPKRIAYVMGLSLLLIYVGTVRMHERYLFPAILLFFIDYALHKDRRSLILGFLCTPAIFINTAIVLDNEMVHGASQGHLLDSTLTLNILISLYNTIVAFFALYMSASNKAVKPFLPKRKETLSEGKLNTMQRSLTLDKKDWLTMLAICLVYSVFAFYQLGSFNAPQSYYSFSNANESLVLELEENEDFNVLFYGPINYNRVYFSTSEDMQNWSPEVPAQMDQQQIFRWKYVTQYTISDDGEYNFSNTPLTLHGKYLKIRSEEAGTSLSEIIVRKADTHFANAQQTKILHILAHENYDTELAQLDTVTNLIDEQDTLEGIPSYYNGSYFDEIYHARTGYEHLHGIRPYETSHPPLGKLFMSLGIWLFGMVPFAYRFFGVVVGVAMLPALYISAKYVFEKRKFAILATLLLALDCLHLTQTRIATIDSYPVFFILLSYLFMYKYMLLANKKAPMNQGLWALFWCGIAFGLSVASKWIGLYAGVGLAILFFTSLATQIANETENRKQAWDKAILTCAYCVFFFILIPFAIYYISYIPYFAPSGGITLNRLIDTQKHMYDYHSTPGLGADHPYHSSWWQWPLILKPMWYFAGQLEPQGFAQTIFAFGNPTVFYLGFVAIILCLLALLWRILPSAQGKVNIISPSYLIGIGFLSQYLPWVIVPRGTFIYHYFASVPFIILATCYILDGLESKFPKAKKAINFFIVLIILVAFGMFIGFYPYATGILTSTKWLDFMKWFPRIWY
ncbi:MAG: phospholipid carrier-dependent glycosyltransferase [Eubacteriales bacterium]|nr:phospholipid carrier-dependent glycosyltransferase [Eubacteriales bacterium]